jgi:hypothetical protein
VRQLVGCQIGGRPRLAVLVETARRAADDHAARGELARDEARIRKLFDPHSDIKTFVDQDGDAHAQHQFDGDCGKACSEIRNRRGQLQNAESRRGIDAQLPARGGMHVAYRLLGFLEIGQQPVQRS